MLPSARITLVVLMFSTASSLTGCAATYRTRPLDMSASEHLAAAAEANARASQETVEAQKGGAAAKHHRALARRSAEIAAEHEDAARALLAAEQHACEGIPPRDIAAGVSELNVVRASVLERPVKFRVVIEGAGIVVAMDGRSFESFAKLMRCRAARAVVTREPSDPLAVGGAFLRVYRDDGDAAVVQLLSKDPESANEIVRRVARQVGSDTAWTRPASSGVENGPGDPRPREWEQDPRPAGSGTSGPKGPGVLPPPGGGRPVGHP